MRRKKKPWKSGPLGPRKAHQAAEGFSPCAPHARKEK
jgi:hypothetical protein